MLTGRRIQNWESTPSQDDEGLSQQDHSEGVSRNKIRYEVVGRLGGMQPTNQRHHRCHSNQSSWTG